MLGSASVVGVYTPALTQTSVHAGIANAVGSVSAWAPQSLPSPMVEPRSVTRQVSACTHDVYTTAASANAAGRRAEWMRNTR